MPFPRKKISPDWRAILKAEDPPAITCALCGETREYHFFDATYRGGEMEMAQPPICSRCTSPWGLRGKVYSAPAYVDRLDAMYLENLHAVVKHLDRACCERR